MTRSDVYRLLEMLNAAYPASFWRMTDAERKTQVALWHDAFKQEPAEIIMAALKGYVLYNKFPPTIAGLGEWVNRLHGGPGDDELLTEAWQAVCGNIRFNDLSAENKMFFGGQARIDNYGLDPETRQTVFAGQYRKAIREIKKNVRAAGKLPETENRNRLEVGG